jgi:hypothetical protein
MFVELLFCTHLSFKGFQSPQVERKVDNNYTVVYTMVYECFG